MSARERGADRDAGFTLVELLVAMVITGLVLGIAGSFFVNVTRSAAAARADRAATGQVSLAVDAVRNVVTTATDLPADSGTTRAVTAGTASSLTVVSYANTVAAAPVPSQYTFALDASGYLTETRQAGVLAASGNWAFTGTTTSRRIGGPYLMTGSPFFSYIDRTGAYVPLTGSSLAADDLASVAFVRVTARSAGKDARGAAVPITASTTVGLTNVFRDIDPTVTLPAGS